MRAQSLPGSVVTVQTTSGPASHGAQCRLLDCPGPGCHPLLLLPQLPQSPWSSVAWPGLALSWVQECPSSTAHLAQMREHCPVSTHHGTEPALRLFPNDLEILAGPGLCPLVRYSETRGQWCDVRIGGCWLMFPNLRPALIVPTVPAPQDMWEALSP